MAKKKAIVEEVNEEVKAVQVEETKEVQVESLDASIGKNPSLLSDDEKIEQIKSFQPEPFEEEEIDYSDIKDLDESEIELKRPMPLVSIGIHNRSKHADPSYESDLASGADIRANLSSTFLRIMPNQRVSVNTGIYLDIPAGVEAQVRPRSGLALKKGITVLNSPGTIDADYKGEIKVILINKGNHEAIIEDGDRIAQLVFVPVFKADFREVDLTMHQSERGSNGFGSTGQ